MSNLYEQTIEDDCSYRVIWTGDAFWVQFRWLGGIGQRWVDHSMHLTLDEAVDEVDRLAV